ncbi:MAG: DUF2683 family protein [Nanoarchaeota archaeon]
MVLATVNIPENENRILNIVKAKYGLKNREAALLMVLQSYGKEILEPELRPEFILRVQKIRKEKHHKFKDINDLRRQIEK